MSRRRLALVSAIGGVLALSNALGCRRADPNGSLASRGTAPPVPSSSGAEPSSDDALRIARAEDRRRASALPPDAQSRSDVTVRRASARALSRILDGEDAPMLRALEDEDGEVVAWAAYGLGESCRGREDGHVRALAARLESWTDARVTGPVPSERDASDSPSGRILPVHALLRALGRCATDAADATVRSWIGAGGDSGEAACYAMGDIAARRGSLSSASAEALLQAVLAPLPSGAALFAFGRPEATLDGAIEPRLVAAAHRQLARPGPFRLFAVRALARTDAPEAAADLESVLLSEDASPAERIEAAAGLSRPKNVRMAMLDEAVVSMTERRLPLEGDGFAVLVSAIDDLDVDLPPKLEAALWKVARAPRAADMSAAALRRLSALRCSASAKLARNAWDSDVLRDCDVADGEAGERARLRALDRVTLNGARRAAWSELTRSTHVRVREAAIEAMAKHPEIGGAGRAVIAAALGAPEPGVVATAAKVVRTHPELVSVAAARERAAVDPSAPAPKSAPATEIDAAVSKKLLEAVARWEPTDRIETCATLIEAALAAGLPEGRAYAERACANSNATLRERATRALAAAGMSTASCEPHGDPVEAPELGHVLARPTRVRFDSDAGALAISFDPALAPVASTRFVALARTGFYTGTSFHRVVPGFVVQFGDRGGDGFGGSGQLLRCETSPAPFAPFDVGVALAGRDTGSSQIFVTLARYPQLDGEYAWVGRAEGDWNAIAEGDVIRGVHVDE